MQRFWQALALILLALMVPASVCCLEPQSDEQPECDCGSAPNNDGGVPSLPSVCPSDTIAHSQLPAPVVLPDMLMIELADLVQTMIRLNDLVAKKVVPPPLATTAPPELRTTWVFMSRAALPARAPSESV